MKKRFRHRVVYAVLRHPFKLYFKLKFRLHAVPFDYQTKGPYLICGNHTQVWDPFYMALCFKEPLYFVASDMIFLHPIFGRIIKYLVEPIPKTKYRSDMATIRDIRSIVQSGGSIGVFPAGNSAYSGTMLPIDPSIAKLAKLLKIPLLLMRIEGGYLSHPRWAKHGRKGRLKAYVSDVITPEEIQKADLEPLHQRIVSSLDVDDFTLTHKTHYVGKHQAEYIENAFYQCPKCHSYASLVSHHNTLTCTQCDLHATAQADGRFYEGDTVYDPRKWFDAQKKALTQTLHTLTDDDILFSDTGEALYQIQRAQKKMYLGQGSIQMTKLGLTLQSRSLNTTIPIEHLSLSVQQKNKLIVYDASTQATYYLLNGKRRNAIKYEHALACLKEAH